MGANGATRQQQKRCISMGNCVQPEQPSSVKEEAKTKTEPSSSKTTNSVKKKKTTRKASSSLHENITIAENPQGCNIYDFYEKVTLIAQGSTCDIWTVRKKKPNAKNRESKGQLYALKIISKAEMNQVFLQEMRNEIDILKRIDHPNIIRVYEKFESHQNIYMVMELCSGGDLYSHEPFPYTEAQAAKVLTNILSAVVYLHKNGIVHRDLKLENVMYETSDTASSQAKLIDFGLSKKHVPTHKVHMRCRVGTVETMSPQVIKGDYTSKADVWSVGVIAFMLLSGARPFYGETEKEIASMIVKGNYSMESEEWRNVSKPAKNFVKKLLTYDPVGRPTASQALSNPWLTQHYSLLDRQPSHELMTSVQNSLVSANKDSKFKKVVTMMIAHKSSNESIKELRDAFDVMDKNNHGTISYWEFQSALKQCNFTNTELKEMFRDLDLNNTGVINYTEFLACTLESRGRIEEGKIAEAFDRIDADNSGYISKENLCNILGNECSAENCDSIVQKILDEVDTDKDGRISYDEFLVLFREKYRDGVNDQCCKVAEEGSREKKRGCS